MTPPPVQYPVTASCPAGIRSGGSTLTDLRRVSVQDALARYCWLSGDPSPAHIVVGEVLCEPVPVARLLDCWGEDALRLALMFAAPPGQSFVWSDHCLRSAARWLAAFRGMALEFAGEPSAGREPSACREPSADEEPSAGRDQRAARVEVAPPGLYRDMDVAVSAVGAYYRQGRVDRAIRATLSMYTLACKQVDGQNPGRALMSAIIDTTLRLLVPVVPGMSRLVSGNRMSWPAPSGQKAEPVKPLLAVAVDGRVRGRIRANQGTSKFAAYRMAGKLENVQRHLAGRHPRKVIYVPDKLINLVVT